MNETKTRTVPGGGLPGTKPGRGAPIFVRPKRPRRGIDRALIEEIVSRRGEPAWLRDLRLEAFDRFASSSLPKDLVGSGIEGIDLDRTFFLTWEENEAQAAAWKEVPPGIRKTFERMGFDESAVRSVAGEGAVSDAIEVHHALRSDLAEKGVVYENMDAAVRNRPDLVREHLGRVLPLGEDRFADLNTAAWTGGTFIHVPDRTVVETPLQAQFQLQGEDVGALERTLIVVGEGASVTYVEGCVSRGFATDSLHAAAVEIVAMPGAHVRYVTMQNWPSSVFNLVTKRAVVHAGARVEWIEGNFGARHTRKRPSARLVGKGARVEVEAATLAGPGQFQDVGVDVVSAAPGTSVRVRSRAVALGGGRVRYGGGVRAEGDGHVPDVSVDSGGLRQGDAEAVSAFHPHDDRRIEPAQLADLAGKGLDRSAAIRILVAGFLDGYLRELPLAYAVEVKRIIERIAGDMSRGSV